MARGVFILTLLVTILFGNTARSQMNVTTESNALMLARKILGQGVTIMNAQFKGGSVSAGFFQASAGSFPISTGIVLTSGRAKSIGTGVGERGVDGPANYSNINDGSHASFIAGQPGDPDLTIFSGRKTKDATVLEFDFIPQGDSINVNYIFGSEEYPRYNCSEFNDVFGFLISGPGFTGPTNIAMVPGTMIPVSINSINDGIPGTMGNLSLCQSTGPGAPFTQYYSSNFGGTVITYNGRTVVLTAKAKVQPCKVYHIKLAIADTEDDILDSGVFIEGGSFSSRADFTTQLTGSLVDASNNVVLVEGCKNAELVINRGVGTVGPFTVNFSFGGSATPGVDYNAPSAQVQFAAADVTKTFNLAAVADAFNEGLEQSVMYLTTTQGCAQSMSDSIVIFIQDSLVNTARKDTFVCSAFPSTLKSRDAVNGTSNQYIWSTGSTSQSITVTQPGTYVAMHTYSQRCVTIDSFNVVNADPLVAIQNLDPVICPGEPVQLNLNTDATSYTWNTGATTQNITVTTGGRYWVRGQNSKGCWITDTIDVAERPAPVIDLGKDTSICNYQTLRLDASSPGATYLWNTGATSPVISVSAPGKYKVIATAGGCSIADSVTIGSLPMPIANAGKDLQVMKGSSVKLKAEQHADNRSYLWSPGESLGEADQPEVTANPTSTTEYTLRVQSAAGCVAEDKVVVIVFPPLNIPNAFSPNGDNINDKWQIGNIDQFPEARVQIFNRYGQEVFLSKGYKAPWDGTLNGKPLAIATYYYVIDAAPGYPRQSGWVVLLK